MEERFVRSSSEATVAYQHKKEARVMRASSFRSIRL
jgi:hypothetical protein